MEFSRRALIRLDAIFIPPEVVAGVSGVVTAADEERVVEDVVCLTGEVVVVWGSPVGVVITGGLKNLVEHHTSTLQSEKKSQHYINFH